jgi:hypothetical protein
VKLLSAKFLLVMSGVWLVIVFMALTNGKLLNAGGYALLSALCLFLYLKEQRSLD